MSTSKILDLFREEISACSGRVADVFDDGERLFARAILPEVREVIPDDRFQGGAAIRTRDGKIWVHPYVYRQVCRNGAIRAHAISSHCLENLTWQTIEQVSADLREAIRAQCKPYVFASSADEIRSSQQTATGDDLMLLVAMDHMFYQLDPSIGSRIMNQMFDDEEHSLFDLMNAVTSMARDTSDPEFRWSLEELGAQIPLRPAHFVSALPGELSSTRHRHHRGVMVS